MPDFYVLIVLWSSVHRLFAMLPSTMTSINFCYNTESLLYKSCLHVGCYQSSEHSAIFVHLSDFALTFSLLCKPIRSSSSPICCWHFTNLQRILLLILLLLLLLWLSLRELELSIRNEEFIERGVLSSKQPDLFFCLLNLRCIDAHLL